MTAFYNDNDPAVCTWLRELAARGLVENGTVDERSIRDLRASDLAGHRRVHLFAGIGGWDYALRLAGWPADWPVWTGSCPCQPFSAAGKRLGTADERHLWPEMFRLISECRPEFVFGEQVASAIGFGWLDRISADLEGEDYAVGAVVLGAHSVGAPHIRQRLYWVAVAEHERARPGIESIEEGARQRRRGPAIGGGASRVAYAGRAGDEFRLRPGEASCQNGSPESETQQRERSGLGAGCGGVSGGLAVTERLARIEPNGHATERRRARDPEQAGLGGEPGGLEHAAGNGRHERRAEPDGRSAAGGCGVGGLDDAIKSRLEGHAGDGDNRNEPGRIGADATGSVVAAGGDCRLPDTESGGLGILRDAELAWRGGHADGRDAWSDYEFIHCGDGKARRIKPGLAPLVNGISGRLAVVRPVIGGESTDETETHWYSRRAALCGFGNAIVPKVAAAFVRAFLETETVQ